jgi:hypothetical protein
MGKCELAVGIKEIQDAMVAFTVKSMFCVRYHQAILDIQADRFRIFQSNVFFPLRKPRIVNQKIVFVALPGCGRIRTESETSWKDMIYGREYLISEKRS